MLYYSLLEPKLENLNYFLTRLSSKSDQEFKINPTTSPSLLQHRIKLSILCSALILSGSPLDSIEWKLNGQKVCSNTGGFNSVCNINTDTPDTSTIYTKGIETDKGSDDFGTLNVNKELIITTGNGLELSGSSRTVTSVNLNRNLSSISGAAIMIGNGSSLNSIQTINIGNTRNRSVVLSGNSGIVMDGDVFVGLIQNYGTIKATTAIDNDGLFIETILNYGSIQGNIIAANDSLNPNSSTYAPQTTIKNWGSILGNINATISRQQGDIIINNMGTIANQGSEVFSAKGMTRGARVWFQNRGVVEGNLRLINGAEVSNFRTFLGDIVFTDGIIVPNLGFHSGFWNTKAGKFTGNIENNSKALFIWNQNIQTGHITNKGSGFTDIANDGTIKGNLINDGLGSMLIQNGRSISNAAGRIEGGIINNNSGAMTIQNLMVTSGVSTITQSIINNNSGVIVIVNSGAIQSDIINNSNGSINLTNSGSIRGVTNENDGSMSIANKGNIEGLRNNGSGTITLMNQGIITKKGSYHLQNSSTGQILVKDYLVDLEPYLQSHVRNGDFSDAYSSRLSISGRNIHFEKLSVKLTKPNYLDKFISSSVNISQFIEGAFIDETNRNVHDCINDKTDCMQDENGNFGYTGEILREGLKKSVNNPNFISIAGLNAAYLTIKDKYGNFKLTATPKNSGATHLNKVLLSSMRKRVNFINDIITASIGEFKYHLYYSLDDQGTNPTNPNRFFQRLDSAQNSHYERGELHASNINFQSLSRHGASFIFPYFISHNISLDNKDQSKGHNTGIILGYTSVTVNDTFYSIYGGYEDMNSNSNLYNVNSKAWYLGFKLSDHLRRLGDRAELVVQYDGNIIGMQNNISDNEENMDIQASPKSYVWSLGTDIGVNFFRGNDIFVPQLGLAYEGGTVSGYRLDVPFKKTKINTYHTRARMVWARDWNPYLQTSFQIGLRYYFNPNVDINYSIADQKIEAKTEFSRWNKFVGIDFIVPLNKAFHFKLGYNGAFSKDGDNHTAFVSFNYVF